MKIWQKIKSGFRKGSGKLSETTEELVEKGQDLGGQGLERVKAYMGEVGDKVSEVSNVIKLKYDVGYLKKTLELEALGLGKMILAASRSKKNNLDEEPILNQLKDMVDLENRINANNNAYDEFRKSLSDDYVVNKLNDELAASGAVIDQVLISEKSNVNQKLLKEILLPKEALISVIKRGENVIIPDGNTQLLKDDIVTVIGKESDVAKIVKRLSAV